MAQPPKPLTDAEVAARRKRVLRTAWAIGLVALGVYVAFLLSGAFGQ